MIARPLSRAHEKALTAMLRGPLKRGKAFDYGDCWIAQDKSCHALSTVRTLHQRGLVLPPTGLAVLTIAGRREAQKSRGEAA